MTSPEALSRRGRLGARKSNTGCITCKIRKVKCDERHPACQRCLATGRKCDGYIHNGNIGRTPLSTNSTMVHPARPTTYANLDRVELQSFEFFMRRFVPSSTRIVDGQFWHQLVPQISHSDPVIWDAVIALSCLTQHPQYSRAFTLPDRKKPPIVNEEHRRALTWYGRSMAGLRKRIEQTTAQSASAVISCILYICIECLQDNVAEATALWQRAIEMMRSTAGGQVAKWPATQLERSLARGVRDLLQNMAASQRIRTQWERKSDKSNTPFQTLPDARDELFVLLFESHDFIVDVMKIIISQGKDWTPPSELSFRQQSLQSKFLRWHEALETMMMKPELECAQDDSHEDEHYSVLLVTYGQYFITVCTILNMYETAFDNFLPMFQSMVDHAGHVVAAGSKETRPVFIFETRVIPQLFFVATKCRHPVVRRQAISLLRTGAEVENTWKADTLADIAERVVGTEESGSIDGVFCPEPSTMELPPEDHRMCRDRIIELPGPDGQPTNFHHFETWKQGENQMWCLVKHLVKV
ncbi:uncharacterized protein A1O9_03281 [Exophiala aquamarina CBS 119918]|uniref:Zn(2)-C6 fungal-type domain-containing protein n=1 Tax=Exophiala aquamarina CBS 119918 TaxID=1182545 RepID=A0A072PPP4_9EURO|nr:uncharacterized protein A1O9_03281 [Exophiala aquamarina CBS 119918]KEF61712.1 hypothetical protein A1O9_03281 [Exophiala aquamarina CBS 119918]